MSRAKAPPPPPPPRLPNALTVPLAGVTDWPGFVRAARSLVRHGLAPEAVTWVCDQAASDGRTAPAQGGAAATGDLFSAAPGVSRWRPEQLPPAAPLGLPAGWVDTARTAALHADPQRLALIYRIVWRMHQGETVADDPLDPDQIRLARLAQAVRREAHKMKAFVRFRPVLDEPTGQLRHVAWFEPAHFVEERVAPFFMRRFAQMHWLILTPRVGIAWNGDRLVSGPGGQRADAVDADAGEALWLAYYRSIFNPARLKVAMMKREMPVRFWHNLPEARQIGALVQSALARTGSMLAQPLAEQRTRPRAVAVDRAVAALPSRQAAAEPAAPADAGAFDRR